MVAKYIFCFLFLGSALFANKAIAVIHPTKGSKVEGTVTFTQKGNTVLVQVAIEGLSPGKHGFHIHEYGDCSAPDATSAGGHFNPTQKTHGCPGSSEQHVGDLGNLIADRKGRAYYEESFEGLSLEGPESIIGKAVIIHEKQDDCVSQPTGDAGSRVGCGVIGVMKPEN